MFCKGAGGSMTHGSKVYVGKPEVNLIIPCPVTDEYLSPVNTTKFPSLESQDRILGTTSFVKDWTDWRSGVSRII